MDDLWKAWRAAALLFACGVRMTVAVAQDEVFPIPPLPPDLLATCGYKVDHWSAEQGHPLRGLRSLAQTRDGFVWVGTPEGLYRFNGESFTKFDKENVPALENTLGMDLFCDSSNRLWIGGNSNMAVLFQNHVFVKIPIASTDRPTLARWWFGETPEGEIWTQVHSSDSPYPLGRFADGGFTRAAPSVGSYGIDHFAHDRNGILWTLPSSRRSLARHDATGSHRVEIRLPDGSLETDLGYFFRLNDQTLAITGSRGIHALTTTGWQLLRPFSIPLPCPQILASVQDRNGNYWISAKGGIYVSRASGQLERMILPEQHDLTVFTALTEGAQGNIWAIGSASLYRIHPNLIRSWGESQGIDGARVISVVIDGKDRTWVTTARQVYQFDGNHLTPVGPTSPRALWLGTPAREGGLYLCHKVPPGRGTGYDIEYRNGEEIRRIVTTTAEVHCLREAGTGELWVGCGNGLLRVSDTTEQVLIPGIPAKASITDIDIDHQGRVLVAAYGHGLYRLEDGTWRRLGSNQDPGSTTIEAIHVDDENLIWIGSMGHGLAFWSQEHGLVSRLHPKLPTQIHAVVADHRGGIWVASEKGLVRIPRREFLDGTDDLGSKTVTFDQSDGLLSRQLTGRQTGLALGGDGQLWISTLLGVSLLDTASCDGTAQHKNVPPVYIDEITADAAAIWRQTPRTDSPVVVSPGWGQLAFHYATANSGGATGYRFWHRLIGYDDQWVDAGNNKSAVYFKLPPGGYEFQVFAGEQPGVAPGSETAIRFRIHPSWWQRRSVRGATMSLAILSPLLLFQRRRRIQARRQARQEQFSRELIKIQEAERKRVAAELHDGLGQNLLLINNGIDELRRGGGGTPDWRHAVGKIKGMVDESVDEIRSISQNLHPFKLERLGLTETLLVTARQAAEVSGLHITADADDVDDLFPDDTEINIYRIVQEALNNAIKHSMAATVELTVKRHANAATFEVKDDGCGFNASLDQATDPGASGGFGLTGMEERARISRGSLRLKSRSGRGTSVLLEIPIPEK